MIVGVGIDVVDIARFVATVERVPRLRLRLFTEAERDLPDQSLAARFAAKEAIAKALGTGIGRGVSWQDIQIEHNGDGAPLVRLSGGALATAQRRGAGRVELSLADESDYVVAFAVLAE